MENKIIMYNEMLEKTKEFYDRLGVAIPKDKEDLSVQSLTMPQYAKEYNDKSVIKIHNNNGLATVGDAVCSAWLMINSFTKEKTKKELHDKKGKLTNANLNDTGKELLESFLFASNNDLISNEKDKPHKKAYATAFEAVIGFISISDFSKIDSVLSQYIIIGE